MIARATIDDLCDLEPCVSPEPTCALPGSPQKIEVLRARATRGERLWHPQDSDAQSEPAARSWTPQPGIRELAGR